MKTLLQSMCLSILWCSCKEAIYTASKKVQIAAIYDVTDSAHLVPHANSILALFDFKKDKNIEARFRISTVTNKQHNPTKEVSLPHFSITEKDNADDPHHRDKCIVAFYTDVRKAIADYTTSEKNEPLQNSECFRTIAGQLNAMSKQKSDENILLVYSDLLELSDIFSCYSPTNRKLLHTNPEKVAKLFEATKLLPDNLTGTTVYFLHETRSREEDKVYMDMITLYKQLLEPRGATVEIKSTSEFAK